MFFERREFLKTLYKCLPNKSRVQTGKKVVQIKETYNSVEVLMSDGTSEIGDMIVGCDGIHSLVR
jgi:2-polyprenyl-6-methoxyphenol hydroxylase-like FAD-dependent oxidoreductase